MTSGELQEILEDDVSVDSEEDLLLYEKKSYTAHSSNGIANGAATVETTQDSSL